MHGRFKFYLPAKVGVLTHLIDIYVTTLRRGTIWRMGKLFGPHNFVDLLKERDWNVNNSLRADIRRRSIMTEMGIIGHNHPDSGQN